MRNFKELTAEIYKSVEYTNQEQNEDIPFEIVLETILHGRNTFRLDRMVKQFNITSEELTILKNGQRS